MIRKLKEKSAGRSSLVLLLVVGLMVGSASAGMLYFFILEDQTTLHDPVDGYSKQTNFSTDIYPGDQTSNEFAITNSGSNDYSVVAEIHSFNDTDNTTGVEAARNESVGAYVQSFDMGQTDYTYDLLNDGHAQADYLNLGSKDATGNITLAVTDDAGTRSGGQVNVTLGFKRGTTKPPEGAVRLHRNFSSQNCDRSGCHDDMSKFNNTHRSGDQITVTSVHEGFNATDCQSCHGRSQMDIHMSCLAGCHNRSELSASHLSQSATNNGFTCTGGCHNASNTQLALAHIAEKPSYSGNSRYICESCHSEPAGSWTTKTDDKSTDVVDAHTWGPPEKFDDCRSCHGINSTQMHAAYTNADCVVCHG